MSPEKQRVSIAKACGWIIGNSKNDRADFLYWTPPGCVAKPNEIWLGEPPNYLGDLNEMHEAIITKFVTIEMQQKFAMQLRNVIKKAPPFASRSWSDWDLITAPLPQLSEAFLRTLGLLEEEQ